MQFSHLRPRRCSHAHCHLNATEANMLKHNGSGVSEITPSATTQHAWPPATRHLSLDTSDQTSASSEPLSETHNQSHAAGRQPLVTNHQWFPTRDQPLLTHHQRPEARDQRDQWAATTGQPLGISLRCVKTLGMRVPSVFEFWDF